MPVISLGRAWVVLLQSPTKLLLLQFHFIFGQMTMWFVKNVFFCSPGASMKMIPHSPLWIMFLTLFNTDLWSSCSRASWLLKHCSNSSCKKEFGNWNEFIFYCSSNPKISCCSIVRLKKGIETKVDHYLFVYSFIKSFFGEALPLSLKLRFSDK